MEGTSLLVQLGSNLADIARLYRVLETDLVKSCVECEMSRDVLLYKNSAALCHNLALDYSRNDRVAREMSPCEELIFLDGVFAMCNTVLINFGLIHQKHRLSVREELFDIFLVHICSGFSTFGLVLVFAECYAGIVSAESE